MSASRLDTARAAASRLFGSSDVPVTSDDRYSALRAEVDAMSAVDGPGGDWERVETLAAELLRDCRPDLLVVVYFAVARHRRHSLDGLLTGLLVVTRAVREFWNDITPIPIRPRARGLALQWMVDQFSSTLDLEEKPSDTDDTSTLATIVAHLNKLNNLTHARLESHSPNFGNTLRKFERALATRQEDPPPAAHADGASISQPFSFGPKERLNLSYRLGKKTLLEEVLEEAGASADTQRTQSEWLEHLVQPLLSSPPQISPRTIMHSLWTGIGLADRDVVWIVLSHPHSDPEEILPHLRADSTPHGLVRILANFVANKGLVDDVLFSLTLQRCPERGKIVMAVARLLGIEISVRLNRRPQRKLLLLTADAESSGSRLLLDKERQAIYDKVSSQDPARDEFTVIDSPAADFSRATLDISRHRPDIVHFGGHGRPDGRIIFLGRDGGSNPASPDVVAALFSRATCRVWLAVFLCCTSAPAARLVSRHAEWSIGFTGAITDSTSLTFAPTLYERIGAGTPVPQAFALAKNAAVGEGDNDAAQASLFYQGHELPIGS